MALCDPVLDQAMLTAINADRRTSDLALVAWDATASQVGVLRAADMAAQGYFSHWDRSGHGPEIPLFMR